MPKVAGREVAFIMATRVEYGAELAKRFDPFICEVGPVEAALHTARYLAENPCDLVVHLGSGGSKRLEQGAIFQITSVAYRDMDASAFGFDKGVTPFSGLPATITIPHRIEGIAEASLSTGASVVSGDGFDVIAEDIVDMESWAVLRAAQVAGIPYIGLRGVSDGAEPVSGYSDWTKLLGLLDERLAEAVDQLVEQLESGSLLTQPCAPPDAKIQGR